MLLGGLTPFFLLAYFGEKDAEKCGQCDVCLKTIDHGFSEEKYKELSIQVLEILSHDAAGVDTLVEMLQETEKTVAQVLERMLQEGKIKRRVDLKFEL